MKKLKLKLDGIKEMLTREQMKKISGGSGPWCPFYPWPCTGSGCYDFRQGQSSCNYAYDMGCKYACGC